jgi:quinoprotein glucose dehydrogenase
MSRPQSIYSVTRCVPIIAVLFLLALSERSVLAQNGAADGEWRHYGGDAGSTRYSPLDQITPENVDELEIAWRWKAASYGPRPEYNYQATPLMVDGVLYVTAGTARDVVAIDATSGETLWMWRYDGGERADRAPRKNHRGVAYWTDGTSERILYITAGYRLISLDANSGRPDPTFGDDGIVDLFDGLDRPRPEIGRVGASSPPMIVGDIAVVGSAMSAFSRTRENIAGFVRGYDVRTGERRWIFHTIPQPGEYGNDTWENDSWQYTGNTGAWAPMAADPELGYVYLPLETPTNDLYGGDRPGDNLFAESLVALDATTGERVWHFQFIHHGIWDWDIPTAPMLIDITVDGRTVKAIAQVTKQAWTYVFDRVTGEPVWPIEERPVPIGDVPGEWYSPTQPFPTKPDPFDRQGISAGDLIDFTPEIRAEALRIASEYRMGPIFTPPSSPTDASVRGTLMLPGLTGGANWQGGAVDAETGILYVSSISNPMRGAARPPTGSLPDFSAMARAARARAPTGPAGCNMMGPLGLPLVKPPWGRITAIDLNTGDHLWMVPNGDTPDCVKNHPALEGLELAPTGKAERGGILVTRTLVFAGEGSGLFAAPRDTGGPMFRAHDKLTGEVVAEFELPAHQTGLPMTYLQDGQQFIVVAVGARNHPAELVALTLP